MILDLVDYDNRILKSPTSPFVFGGDKDPYELTDTMFQTMYHNIGLGLSANQIGIDASVFVMGYDHTAFEVFNPEIVNITGRDVMMPEGCLSFPNCFLQVNRPGSIHVKFQNKDGVWREEVYGGMTARIFLHEYDHMKGITFDQKVSRMKWDMALKRKNKLDKKIQRSKI